jgi:hypothetical protein
MSIASGAVPPIWTPPPARGSIGSTRPLGRTRSGCDLARNHRGGLAGRAAFGRALSARRAPADVYVLGGRCLLQVRRRDHTLPRAPASRLGHVEGEPAARRS